MNKLIAYYEINKIKYYISLLNNNKIVFLKSDKNHNFSINLTNKELKIINKVYNSLKPNLNKSVYIKEFNINNNNYKLYLDKSNHNYFWLPTSGMYDEIDSLHLNFKYNHQEAILYSNLNQLKESKLSKFYNKLINIGSKIIPVFLSATISLSLLNGCTIIKQENIDYPETSIAETIETTETTEETIDSIVIEIEEEIEDTEIKREYNYEEIRQAIENNPNLSEEEKEFLYKIKFVFDDNGKFMDLDKVIRNIRTLKVEYNANIPGADAAYNIMENKIYIESENFSSVKKAHFVHEFLHCLQGVPVDFIGELSTEFFTKETMVKLYKEGLIEKEELLSPYAKKEYKNNRLKLETEEQWLNYLYKHNRFSSGYEGYSNLYMLLAEIIPIDALRQYQFNPQTYDNLINELIIIDSSYNQEESTEIKISRAYELIESLNDLRVYIYEVNAYKYEKNATNFCNRLNHYYKIKKGQSLNENIVTSLYLEYAEKLQFDFENKIINYLEECNIDTPNALITKTYLSNSQEKNILTHYMSDEQIALVEINQDIEAKYSEYLHPTTEHIRGYTR